jgi:hypothetical protein
LHAEPETFLQRVGEMPGSGAQGPFLQSGVGVERVRRRNHAIAFIGDIERRGVRKPNSKRMEVGCGEVPVWWDR